MTIVDSGLKFTVGQDFIDCVTGAIKCRGEVRTNKMTYAKPWESTLDQQTTEHAFRATIGAQGLRITFYKSQAV